jgi:hypothetical protein
MKQSLFIIVIVGSVLLAVAPPAQAGYMPTSVSDEAPIAPSYETHLPELPQPVAAQYDSDENVPSVGSYAKDFVPDLWYGTKRMFSSDNIPLAAIGFGTAALALTVDHRVSDHFKRTTPLSEGAMNLADTIGNGAVEIGAGVALFGTGELIDDKRMADAGAVSLEAFLINGAFTEGLKYITHRERPNGGDYMSFPSGHASNTAAFSAAVSEMYDWNPWIAVPLYLTTAYVGLSRIQAQEHYLSDVIAGITLGTLVGSSVGKYHKEKGASTGGVLSNMTILPVYERDVRGFVVKLKF